MSKLGSLFGGGGDTDSNDALKYSAPKEPKKAVASPAPASTAAVTSPAPAAAAPKMMASATVRLYKVNSATGAYEVQAGGGPLGCVIFGSGLQNQILVYNAQRAPQATVSINGDFVYNIRDTYVSFADSMKNNWSLLFDNEDIMHKFLRALVATVAHAACFAEPPGQKVITGALPGVTSTSAAETEDATVLSAGYLAGIQYNAWELCAEASGSPAEAIAGTPFKSVSLPDLAKVKVSADGAGVEEPLGGLSSSLLNRKKGDRYMLAIPPSVLQRGTVDMRLRQRPTAWMVVEVEIMKVKDGSKEKKEKKEKAPAVIAPAESAPEQRVPFGAASESPERARSNSLKDRMAHLAQAGGGMQMGIPAGARPADQGNPAKGQGGHPSESMGQQAQQQQAPLQGNNNNNAYSAQSSVPPQTQNNYQGQGQGYNQQQMHQQQPPQQFNNYQQQQQPPQQQIYGQQQGGFDNQYGQYAVALVPGQEARSHFMGDMNQAGMQGRFPVERQSIGGQDSSMQQSVSTIQATVMQLNHKMDTLLSMNSGMGMQGMNPQMMHMQQMGWGSGGFNRQQAQGSMKGRGDEVIAMVSAMVEEFDKKSNSAADDNGMKEQVEKLQGKLETLQERNEKLMHEKSDLLDRQSNMLQTSAASSAKTYELQHEVERLRREKEQSDNKLSDLLRNVETLQQQAASGGQDRSKLLELEADLSRAQSDKKALEQTVSDLRDRAAGEDAKWTQRMAEERSRADTAVKDLAVATDKIASLAAAASSSSGPSDQEVQERINAAVRETEAKCKVELASTLAEQKAFDANDKEELEKKVAELNETIGNLTDELIKASAAPPPAPAPPAEVSAEQLKELVQIIYGKLHERLVPEDDEEVTYVPGVVMQHVRAVMKTAVAEHSAVAK